jgi:hypothetical protein
MKMDELDGLIASTRESYAGLESEFLAMNRKAEELLQQTKAALTVIRSLEIYDSPDEKKLKEVCNELGLSLGCVLNRSRHAELVAARKKVAERLRAEGWELHRIGRALRITHTAVMHYLRQ